MGKHVIGNNEGLVLAETRPSHRIKINVRYRETLASANDSNLT
jgi:hypothetical protein